MPTPPAGSPSNCSRNACWRSESSTCPRSSRCKLVVTGPGGVLQLASPAVERTTAIGYTASAMGPELLERIRLAAARLVERGASSVYLFGSMTTGRAREDSDFDLAVAGLPPQIFFAALAEATRIIGRPVDLLALERHPELAEELFRSGELQRVA